MDYELYIGVLTTPNRQETYELILEELFKQQEQLNEDERIYIIESHDNFEKKIGTKRNECLNEALDNLNKDRVQYFCFIDSDDMVDKDYLNYIFKAMKSKPDAISFQSLQTDNNMVYNFSIKHKSFNRVQREITWPVGHLNPVKLDLLENQLFKELNYREDVLWSEELMHSGKLKVEVNYPKVLYYYQYSNELSDARKVRFKE
jgi:hypothetical protein